MTEWIDPRYEDVVAALHEHERTGWRELQQPVRGFIVPEPGDID
ncbi:hypothetical protein [Streptomyces sp. WM6372]|nr:hypothetical protein [Streptomyces sp. WM6372]